MEWVTAKELLLATGAKMTRQTTNESKALCRRAHAGLIRARAKVYRVDGLETRNSEIPKGFWWHEGEAALEQDWEQGDFSWSYNHQRANAIGVEFSREDAEGLGLRFNAPPSTGAGSISAPPDKNKGGRRLSELWPEYVAELCAYFHDEGVPPGVGTEGAEAIIDGVADRLAKRGVETISRSTAQAAVNATLKRLRADN